jgi:imidazoleglycerol-phosphate dehydratase
MARISKIHRKTNETDIALELNLDGGAYDNKSGVGFFDHMLDHIGRHGKLGLKVACKGDTQVDDHHSVEDIGIALGLAIKEAVGDKRGIERYGFAAVPMDETLARVALDLSGRPSLVFRVEPECFSKYATPIGTFDVQLVREFFNAVANHAGMNLHIEVPWGSNNHHIAEGIFKAFGRALREAVKVTGTEIPSTKGVI